MITISFLLSCLSEILWRPPDEDGQLGVTSHKRNDLATVEEKQGDKLKKSSLTETFRLSFGGMLGTSSKLLGAETPSTPRGTGNGVIIFLPPLQTTRVTWWRARTRRQHPSSALAVLPHTTECHFKTNIASELGSSIRKQKKKHIKWDPRLASRVCRLKRQSAKWGRD